MDIFLVDDHSERIPERAGFQLLYVQGKRRMSHTFLLKALDVKPSQLLEDSDLEKTKEIDLTGIDTRSIKKFKDILSLSSEDRNDLYRILNKMLRKNQLEKKDLEATKY